MEFMLLAGVTMARTTIPLNATQIDKAKPREKEYNLADGGGLSLRVKPNGSKLWLFNYFHPHTKKRKNIGLGQYPAVTLANARSQRDKFKEILSKNIDPLEQRERLQREKVAEYNNTFEKVAHSWLTVHRTKVKASTADKILKSLEVDVFPRIGNYPISQITAPLASEVLNTIIGRNSFEIARKVALRMKNVMTFAVNAGLAPHNPLTGIRELIPSKPTKHYPTIKPEELPELMSAIRYSNTKVTTKCLLEFQLHTLTRPSEAARAQWSEFDFDNMLWTIPADKMKQNREHIIPLTEQVIELLTVMRPLTGHREYVFASPNNPKNHVNKETANTALKRMGFKDRLVAHGMRALGSTTLNEQGFEYDVIESALAHEDKNQVRKAYNRAQYIEKRRVMMRWWSEHIEQAKTGKISGKTSVRALKAI